MGKKKQIANTIGVGIVGAFLLFALIGGLVFTSGKTLLTLSGFSFFIGVTILIVYFLFLLKSFSNTNLDNSYFNWAFYLNLIVVVLNVLSILGSMIYLTITKGLGSFDMVNIIMDVVGVVGVVLFVISFVVFVVGYFKNKKEA